MGNVYDVPPVESESAGKLEGISVSPGIYEGIARLIQNPTDFHRLQQGDVLISKCDVDFLQRAVYFNMKSFICNIKHSFIEQYITDCEIDNCYVCDLD